MTSLNFFRSSFLRRGMFGVIGLLMVALPACDNPNEIAEVQEETNVTTEEIQDDIETLVGETVTVRASVEDTVGDTAFLLEDSEPLDVEDILIFNASGQPFLLPEGDDDIQVQVTGEVQQFVIAEIEETYGLELDEELFVDYEQRPAIIAQSIALAPEPEEITENPELFYNQLIAVGGEVDEILSPGTFTLEEEGFFENDSVLVIGVEPTPGLEDAEEVTVTGILRPYVQADFDRDYDLQWDLEVQEQIEAEYTEEPVLVAQEVYPSAQ